MSTEHLLAISARFSHDLHEIIWQPWYDVTISSLPVAQLPRNNQNKAQFNSLVSQYKLFSENVCKVMEKHRFRGSRPPPPPRLRQPRTRTNPDLSSAASVIGSMVSVRAVSTREEPVDSDSDSDKVSITSTIAEFNRFQEMDEENGNVIGFASNPEKSSTSEREMAGYIKQLEANIHLLRTRDAILKTSHPRPENSEAEKAEIHELKMELESRPTRENFKSLGRQVTVDCFASFLSHEKIFAAFFSIEMVFRLFSEREKVN